MGAETNFNLDTVTEQTIFNFLMTIFYLLNTTKFVVVWNI